MFWGRIIYMQRIFFQMVDADFDIKTKILELLQDKDFDKKRARTMDIDDFLQ